VKVRLTADLRAPAAARRVVLDRLRDLTPESRALWDDIALIVSELVTNAVRAGAQDVDVEMHVDDERVDVRITDDAPGWPTQRTAGVEGDDGRGLAIVDELADTWRIVRRGAGKSVIATRLRRG
jgi:anti-sigma regulatory factor (Ser/Thr protein kinase)